jgi:DNA polymerase I
MEILDAIWIFDKLKDTTVIRYADAKKRRKSMNTDIPPYFFIRRKDKPRIMEIPSDRVGKVREIYDNGEFTTFDGIPAIKIIVDMPSSVPHVRDPLEAKGVLTFESDTPYIKRWMIDGGHTQCPIEDILYADIEVDGRERFGTVKTPTQQIMSIGMIDNDGNENFIAERNEKTLLQEFLRIVTKKYHLITGWNFNDYDWPYIVKRMERLGMRKPFIPIQRLDSMTAYQRFILPTIKAEKVGVSLDECGLRHLGIGKTEKYDAFKMWDSFMGDQKDLKEYNMRDVELNKSLNEQLHLLDPYLQSVNDFPLTLTELERMSYVWEALLMKECQTRNPRLVIPRKRSSADAEDVDLGGGNILQTVAGYHANVIEMDFKGLYPSMMRMLGISPEYVSSWQSTLGTRFPHSDILSNFIGIKAIPWDGPVDALQIDLSAVADYSKFVQNEVYNGRNEPMFRKVLGHIQDMRDYAKKERDKYTEGTEEYTYWESRQLFYKVVLVSSYGVSGLKSGKFFMPNFVNLLTYTTGATIEKASEVFEEKDWMVTYGHTDSCIIRRKENDLDTMEVIQAAKPLADELNKEIREWLIDEVNADMSLLDVISIKPEKIATDMLLSDAKTKKIMDVIWTEGVFGHYRFVGGAEYKRVDAFPLLGRVQMDLTDMVFKKKTTFLSQDWQDYMDDLREQLYSGVLNEELLISKSLGEEIEDYKTDLPHVRVAKALQKRGMYRHGEKVRYVVASNPKGKYLALPVIDGEPFPRIDSSGYKYYYDAIKRLVDRWATFETTEQSSLDDWECSS